MTAYTKSTNFLTKDTLPDGDTGKIIRGSEFNVEFDNLQTAVNSKANAISPTLSGTPTAPTAGVGTNNTQLATTAFVQTAANAAFPSGGIIIWSGSALAIPAGWLLCDGTNSTPNLQDRFVVGAGNTYAVGATGGSANAVVVSHTHSTTVSDPGHTHVYGGKNPSIGVNYSGSGGNDYFTYAQKNLTTNAATTGISVSNSTTGVSGTNANLPPYYALCYIMKA